MKPALNLYNVSSLQTLGSLVYRELYSLTFFQRFEAGFLNSSVVDKDVITTGRALNKPKPLGIVEPFHGTLFFHAFLFPFYFKDFLNPIRFWLFLALQHEQITRSLLIPCANKKGHTIMNSVAFR
jgi:hypothetical protein